ESAYFKPGDGPKHEPAKTSPPTAPASPPPVNRPPVSITNEVADKDKDKILALGMIKIEETAQPLKEKTPPDDAGRKIIRTGDLDFEVESFDNAVKTIDRLLAGIKGTAFRVTKNS